MSTEESLVARFEQIRMKLGSYFDSSKPYTWDGLDLANIPVSKKIRPSITSSWMK
jgi:hypothetical protein